MLTDTLLQSENTFLLALDGDVDFKPEALQLLVDRLKKNKKVGVVCGRIHPIGSGMMYDFSDQIVLYHGVTFTWYSSKKVAVYLVFLYTYCYMWTMLSLDKISFVKKY